MNLDRTPIDELKVEPVTTVAIEARYGGKIVLREVTVRPKEGSSYGHPEPDPAAPGPFGIRTSVDPYLRVPIPIETRYTLSVIDTDDTQTEVMLTGRDLLAITRTVKHTLRVR